MPEGGFLTSLVLFNHPEDWLSFYRSIVPTLIRQGPGKCFQFLNFSISQFLKQFHQRNREP